MPRSIAGLAAAILLVGMSVSVGAADESFSPAQRGQLLAHAMCASCHAIGKVGDSPHVNAPPFRRFERLIGLDTFVERLNEGLMTGHSDMPAFRFSSDDAQALVAFLRSVQAP
jgi:mono/diheme cytochrome c family protein